jgi:DNA-binding MarR family transcriptional regulator
MDQVGHVAHRWRELRPELDPAPMLVVGRIQRLARIMDAALRPTFAGAGLAPGDFDILAALRRASPAHARTAGELHQALAVTTGAISKQVDRLAARGLVTRTVGGHDGRVRDVALTDTGLRLVDELIAVHLAAERRLIAALSSEDESALANLLERLVESLDTDSGGPGAQADPRVSHPRQPLRPPPTPALTPS